MKKSEFRNLLTEIIAPVVKEAVREELESILNATSEVDDVLPMKSTLADTISESIDDYDIVDKNGKLNFDAIKANTKPFTDSGPKVKSNLSKLSADDIITSNPIQKKKLDEVIDSDKSLSSGEKGVLKALSRDYSELVKKMNSTKGAYRKPVYRS